MCVHVCVCVYIYMYIFAFYGYVCMCLCVYGVYSVCVYVCVYVCCVYVCVWKPYEHQVFSTEAMSLFLLTTIIVIIAHTEDVFFNLQTQ